MHEKKVALLSLNYDFWIRHSKHKTTISELQLFFVINPYKSRDKTIHRARFSPENSYPMYQDKKKHQKKRSKSTSFFSFQTPKLKNPLLHKIRSIDHCIFKGRVKLWYFNRLLEGAVNFSHSFMIVPFLLKFSSSSKKKETSGKNFQKFT